MIKWNKVTWYSKLGAIILFVGVLPALAFYIGTQYELTSEVVSGPVIYAPLFAHTTQQTSDYSYRCKDGTEFSVTPSLDMSTLYITPATSVDKIKRVILTQVESKQGAMYKGSGVTFFGQGEGVRLTMGTSTTTCDPIASQDNAPLNFGD